MKKSDQINELAKALCKFQSDVPSISKDSINPFFKSKYASLHSILKGIKQPLIKNKLSVVQLPVDNYGMTTIVMHESGQWIEETYFMKPTKDTPQEAGSVITYQRRYALGAIFCLDIDEDDDGNKASKAVKTQSAQITPKKKVNLVDALNKLDKAIDLDMLKAVWTEIGKDNQQNEVIINKAKEIKTKLSK